MEYRSYADTGELKRRARESLKGNLGITLLAEILGKILLTIAAVIPFGGLVVSGPILVGTAGVYNRATDHDSSELSDLFSGFRYNFVENFLMALLKGVFIFLWSLLFLIPGIVKGYSYAMTEYLMARDRELTAMDALKLSRELMKGNKFRLLLFQLSFIGWILLMILTCGIAGIFVIPYMQTATTEFFNDIYFEKMI
ncbi:MAG: DUF975 family protein [Lachnospiraceae bacterium]|nr:DUF975 family protein [Lachnospiraceae bacterium]